MKLWMSRCCYLVVDFITALNRHRNWLLLQALLLVLLLGFNIFNGELKPRSEWDWVDICGESAAVLFVLSWLLIILSIRPKGRVTNCFAAGFIALAVAFSQDMLDEFFQLYEGVSWDSWIESTPIGLLLLTVAFWLWRIEQQQINLFLQRRKLLQSRPAAMDSTLHIPDLAYLQGLLLNRSEDKQVWSSTAIIMLELESINEISHRYGGREADRLLLLVTELLLLSLRPQDLLCRFAGQRFVVLLDNVTAQQAADIEMELRRIVKHFPYRPGKDDQPLKLIMGSGLAVAKAQASAQQAVATLLSDAQQALNVAQST